MNERWYLVKRNWPQIVDKSPLYAGVGGDLWPLRDLAERSAIAMHSTMMRSRRHLALGDRVELLCADLSVAELYWVEAQRHFGDAWLLEVTLAALGANVDAGVDLGFAHGGFSVVETELIAQALEGPPLNEWGLVGQVTDALDYLVRRESNELLEQLDCIVPLGVKVVRRSGQEAGM